MDEKTERLINKWTMAQVQVIEDKRLLNRDECALTNAIVELGDWLTPKDAMLGEKFCVWVDGRIMLSVTKGYKGEYLIEYRKSE